MKTQYNKSEEGGYMKSNNENKQLIEIEKESFFSKIKNFFSGLFGKKEILIPVEEVRIETAPSPSQIDLMREKFNEVQEKNTRLLEIQEKYENGDYDLSMLTDDEMMDLMYLYHAQVNEYRKKKENLTKKLNRLKVQ